MDILKVLAAAAAVAVPAAASAHVSVQPQEAKAGGYLVLRFGAGHGCDGKATTAVRIEIPEGVAMANPQPKPGWRLVIEHARDPKIASAIVWKGKLPADQFEEFLILAKLPAEAGPLAFPAVQTCGATEVRWDEPVPTGGPRPQHPAPTISLTSPPPPEGGHDHHH